MDTLISILLIVSGFLFGIFWFALVALPLIYGFPKSIWCALRGQLRWSTPFKYLISPIFWSIVSIFVIVAMLNWTPNVIGTLAQSAAFNLASLFAIGISALRCVFSTETRTDLRADFEAFVKPYRI